MAMDGILIYKIVERLKALTPAKVQKISQISDYEMIFTLRNAAQGRFELFVSAHPKTNHVSLIEHKIEGLDEPKGFVMLARKHLEQSVLVRIEQTYYDRWFTMVFQTYNTLGDPVEKRLVIELMGKYANIILVNETNVILDAVKRIPPFQNQMRTIQPGAQFVPTPLQPERIDPFDATTIDPERSLTSQFYGFGKDLANEVEYRMQNGQSFEKIMDEIKSSNDLFICTDAPIPTHYHCIALTNRKTTLLKMDLFAGLNYIFSQSEAIERLKLVTSDVTRCIKTNLKHLEGKLPKLQAALDEAMECDQYRIYGDLIYTCPKQENGHDHIMALDYSTNENIRVPLDPRYDSFNNAKRYYQKYAKQKKGIGYIQQQIEITEKARDYFATLNEQLDYMDVTAATQIRTQLQDKGYLKKAKGKSAKKKKKDTGITINKVVVNGTTIYYGKNHIQNEQVTFNTNARKGMWFHVQNSSGAHVVLTDHFDDEFYIRLCAQIAALFSKYRYSSSVAVQYCQLNKVRKMPKGAPGQVLLDHYKTIYIDPDSALLDQYGL